MDTALGAVLPTLGLTEGAALGLGFRRYTNVKTPAAGALFTLTFDGSEVWRVATLMFRLQTSAAVANRNLALQYVNEDAAVVAEVPLPASVAASLTTLVSFQVNQASTFQGANGDFCVGLPDILLPGGYTIQMVAAGFQAADQIDRITMVHEAYPHGHLGYPTGTNYLRSGA